MPRKVRGAGVDSSRAMGRWRAGRGRGSGLSLPGGGSSLQTANALACESPSISTNDAIREGGGGTRVQLTQYTLPASDTVARADTPTHPLHRRYGPRTSVGKNALFAETTSMHLVRDPLRTASECRDPRGGEGVRDKEKSERPVRGG